MTMNEQNTLENVLVVLQGMQKGFERLESAQQSTTTAVDSLRMDVVSLKTDVAGLKTDVAGLKTDVAGLKTDVAGLKTDVAGLKTDVAGLKTDVAEVKEDIVAIKDDVEFLRDNMITRDDLTESESRIMTQVDGLTKEHITLDHELVARRARSERLEDRVQVLELRMKIAA